MKPDIMKSPWPYVTVCFYLAACGTALYLGEINFRCAFDAALYLADANVLFIATSILFGRLTYEFAPNKKLAVTIGLVAFCLLQIALGIATGVIAL